MKTPLNTLSQIFLITGLVMVAMSYFVYDFENLYLNLLMYAILSVGFVLNFIVVMRRR